MSIERAQFTTEYFRGRNAEAKEFEIDETARELLEHFQEQYERREQLGIGKSGEVWVGQDPFYSDKTCTKTIHDPHATVNTLRREFEIHQEAERAGIRVPPLLAYIESREGNGDFHALLAMKAIEGRTLEQWFRDMKREGRRFEKSEIKEMRDQLKQMILQLHEANIYHRDLHFGNVMIDNEGNFYIIDFGDAKVTLSSESDQEIYQAEMFKDGQMVTISNLRRDEYILNEITERAYSDELIAA
ncbi:MAG: protein kinase family protein [Candidatus Nomurabacteria bacterium]|nr:MAG: protein kinase family protein [Candidatus Nomurabacteria bacterium]